MTRLVLANIDLRRHMTDEGEQLQAGLEHAGWTLAGFGYGDGCVDVPTLLDRHQPSIVLVQAREDWDKDSPGTFDKRVAFERIGTLADYPCVKVQVVKDGPGSFDRRKAWCEEIKADACLIYYHERSLLAASPWMANYWRVRTHHSIDADVSRAVWRQGERRRAIISGAISHSYPLRQLAVANAGLLGLDVLGHPGYGNGGARNGEYLSALAGYKVHVATASKFGFALRKIIESVAVGCVPVTDLPGYDVLPEIDNALVRVPPGCTVSELKQAIDHAEARWDEAKAIELAERCRRYYDWRATGQRLSEKLCELTNC